MHGAISRIEDGVQVLDICPPVPSKLQVDMFLNALL